MAFDSLSEKLQNVFKNLRSKGLLTEDDVKTAMREVRMALLEADVSFKVVKDFVKKVTERAVGSDVLTGLNPAQTVIKIVNEELIALMGSDTTELPLQPGQATTVIMMVGLQGAGKTTTAAKLAGKLIQKGKKPLLVACDVYRPAAIEQLKINGEKMGVDVFEMGDKNAPVDIAKAGMEHARKNGCNVVIIDTAGRLHVDEAMMQELAAIKEAVTVHETVLVVDAMTGQDAVNVAAQFNEQIGISGVILTKLDGDTRGGAALSIRAICGKPILYCGMGEKLSDLEQFYPDRMASRILGMGDVLTLIEKAQAEIDALTDELDRQHFTEVVADISGFRLEYQKKETPKQVRPLPAARTRDGAEEAEELILAQMMAHPEATARFEEKLGYLTDPQRNTAAMMMIDQQRRLGHTDPAALMDRADNEEIRRLLSRLATGWAYELPYDEKVFDGAVRKIRISIKEAQAEAFRRQLQQPMNAHSRDLLLKEYQECLIELRGYIDEENSTESN